MSSIQKYLQKILQRRCKKKENEAKSRCYFSKVFWWNLFFNLFLFLFFRNLFFKLFFKDYFQRFLWISFVNSIRQIYIRKRNGRLGFNSRTDQAKDYKNWYLQFPAWRSAIKGTVRILHRMWTARWQLDSKTNRSLAASWPRQLGE